MKATTYTKTVFIISINRTLYLVSKKIYKYQLFKFRAFNFVNLVYNWTELKKMDLPHKHELIPDCVYGAIYCWICKPIIQMRDENLIKYKKTLRFANKLAHYIPENLRFVKYA